MHISFSKDVARDPDFVIEAAERWLEGEGTGIPPVRNSVANGQASVAINQLVDGVLISTAFHARELEGATRATFSIRMHGTSLGSKIRNLGMLPMTRIVRREAAEQFHRFLEELAASEKT